MLIFLGDATTTTTTTKIQIRIQWKRIQAFHIQFDEEEIKCDKKLIENSDVYFLFLLH